MIHNCWNTLLYSVFDYDIQWLTATHSPESRATWFRLGVGGCGGEQSAREQWEGEEEDGKDQWKGSSFGWRETTSWGGFSTESERGGRKSSTSWKEVLPFNNLVHVVCDLKSLNRDWYSRALQAEERSHDLEDTLREERQRIEESERRWELQEAFTSSERYSN